MHKTRLVTLVLMALALTLAACNLTASSGERAVISGTPIISIASPLPNATYLEGVMEKYVPGDYEFDVPARLRELYDKKDYGQYGDGGKLPVCFLGSNHTTGGNSGSPAIDAHGNLIGLNFDRVWEGTMSDYNYDVSICRNIMVDARYVLFIVDKYAGATRLIQEMKLVHPKKGGTSVPKKEKPPKPIREKKKGSLKSPEKVEEY